MAGSYSTAFLIALREGIIASFSLGDLTLLCADLGIDYENLAGSSKAAKVLELIQYMKRRNRLSDLLAYCTGERPDYDWPEAGAA